MTDTSIKSKITYEYLQTQADNIVDSFRQVNARVANYLALLAAMIILTVPTFTEIAFVFNNCQYRYLFYIVVGLCILTQVLIFVCIGLVIKTLNIELCVPPVNEDGIRKALLDGTVDDQTAINSYIENYLNTITENRSILKDRASSGIKFRRTMFYSFVILFIYIFTFWAVRLFFCPPRDTNQKKGVVTMDDDTTGPNEPTTNQNGGSEPPASPSNPPDSQPAQLKTSPDLTGKPERINFSEGSEGKNSAQPLNESGGTNVKPSNSE